MPQSQASQTFVPIWEMRPEENPDSYQAMLTYRDLGPSRTLKQVSTILGVPEDLLSEIAQTDDWFVRVRQFDEYIEKQLIDESVKREHEFRAEIEAYRRRLKNLSIASGNAGINMLKKANDRIATLKPEEITPGLLPSYLQTAANIIAVSSRAEGEVIAIDQVLRAWNEGRKAQKATAAKNRR